MDRSAHGPQAGKGAYVSTSTAGRRTGRRALSLSATIPLLLALFAVAAPAAAADGTTLNPDHRGTSWDDEAQNANCPAEDLDLISEGEVLWHFILTSPSSDEATLTATFEVAGTVIQPDADTPSTALHFYVITGTDTLLDAATDIAGGSLNLSHICNEVTVEEPPPGGETPDVSVTKSAEVDGTPITSIAIGESYAYVITITNDGDATAEGVVVNDNLDDELTIDGITATQGACSVTDVENNHVSCDLGDLAPGASAEITISVTATLGAPGNPICRSPVDNESTVSAENEADAETGNNTSNTVVVEIDCSEVGSLKVRKVDEAGARLAGAVFSVEGQKGTFTTDANGEFCITGLPFGDVLTVTEITPPPGYEVVGEASQEVAVDPDGDCDSPEATFVNALEQGGEESGTLEIRKEADPADAPDAFAFETDFGAAFDLMHGETTGAVEVELGDHTVTELLSQAQMDAGWSLEAITCTDDGDAIVDLDGLSVTVSVDDGDAIVCTFLNAFEGEGVEGGAPTPTPREGTQGGNPPTPGGGLPNTAAAYPGSAPLTTLTAALLFLLSVGTLVVATARAPR